MTRKLKETTICTVMALVILTASFVATEMTVRAADPFWGAAYLSPGKNEATVYVDDVSGRITGATLKSWDFSSSVYMGVTIYSPSGTVLQGPVLFSSNSDLAGAIKTCNEPGTYKVVFDVYNGNAGGWVGIWLY